MRSLFLESTVAVVVFVVAAALVNVVAPFDFAAAVNVVA